MTERITEEEFVASYCGSSRGYDDPSTPATLRFLGRYPEWCPYWPDCDGTKPGGPFTCHGWIMGHQHEDAITENHYRSLPKLELAPGNVSWDVKITDDKLWQRLIEDGKFRGAYSIAYPRRAGKATITQYWDALHATPKHWWGWPLILWRQRRAKLNFREYTS